MANTTTEPAITFEAAVARLAEIVTALERGEASLDDSIALFQEGAKLTGHCQKLLQEAEQKVMKLTANGEALPFDGESES